MTASRTRVLLAIPAILVVAACDAGPDEVQERFEPVVVYAGHDHEDELATLFAGFTEETRIPVTLRVGEPGQRVDDVIANRGSPPADVLLTTTVADAWRAADKGALRPIAAANASGVPEVLRDPDTFWAAASVRVAVIAYAPGAAADGPGTYADLARPLYRGKLCLSSSSLSINRSVIAMLIAEHRPRPAETIVRGWLRNLAVPVFATQSELKKALDAGTCEFAIVSSQLANERAIVPQPAYADIEGVGIARHARYPESARRLVDWLLSRSAQSQYAKISKSYPAHSALLDSAVLASISDKNVGLAGWHDNDAVLLAERAGYR